MRKQLDALLQTTEYPNVRLQVIPFQAGGHSADGGAFTILRFPDQDLPDVVYIEHLTSAIYLDKHDDVDQYAAAIGELFIQAEPVTATQQILRRALLDLDA